MRNKNHKTYFKKMIPITSPCVRKCCLNDEDICLGCFRSLSEITDWQQADQQQQRLILAAAENRRRHYQEKYPLFISSQGVN